MCVCTFKPTPITLCWPDVRVCVCVWLRQSMVMRASDVCTVLVEQYLVTWSPVGTPSLVLCLPEGLCCFVSSPEPGLNLYQCPLPAAVAGSVLEVVAVVETIPDTGTKTCRLVVADAIAVNVRARAVRCCCCFAVVVVVMFRLRVDVCCYFDCRAVPLQVDR